MNLIYILVKAPLGFSYKKKVEKLQKALLD